jgi:hypothetical protein
VFQVYKERVPGTQEDSSCDSGKHPFYEVKKPSVRARIRTVGKKPSVRARIRTVGKKPSVRARIRKKPSHKVRQIQTLFFTYKKSVLRLSIY